MSFGTKFQGGGASYIAPTVAPRSSRYTAQGRGGHPGGFVGQAADALTGVGNLIEAGQKLFGGDPEEQAKRVKEWQDMTNDIPASDEEYWAPGGGAYELAKSRGIPEDQIPSLVDTQRRRVNQARLLADGTVANRHNVGRGRYGALGQGGSGFEAGLEGEEGAPMEEDPSGVMGEGDTEEYDTEQGFEGEPPIPDEVVLPPGDPADDAAGVLNTPQGQEQGFEGEPPVPQEVQFQDPQEAIAQYTQDYLVEQQVRAQPTSQDQMQVIASAMEPTPGSMSPSADPQQIREAGMKYARALDEKHSYAKTASIYMEMAMGLGQQPDYAQIQSMAMSVESLRDRENEARENWLYKTYGVVPYSVIREGSAIGGLEEDMVNLRRGQVDDEYRQELIKRGVWEGIQERVHSFQARNPNAHAHLGPLVDSRVKYGVEHRQAFYDRQQQDKALAYRYKELAQRGEHFTATHQLSEREFALENRRVMSALGIQEKQSELLLHKAAIQNSILWEDYNNAKVTNQMKMVTDRLSTIGDIALQGSSHAKFLMDIRNNAGNGELEKTAVQLILARKKQKAAAAQALGKVKNLLTDKQMEVYEAALSAKGGDKWAQEEAIKQLRALPKISQDDLQALMDVLSADEALDSREEDFFIDLGKQSLKFHLPNGENPITLSQSNSIEEMGQQLLANNRWAQDRLMDTWDILEHVQARGGLVGGNYIFDGGQEGFNYAIGLAEKFDKDGQMLDINTFRRNVVGAGFKANTDELYSLYVHAVGLNEQRKRQQGAMRVSSPGKPR